MKNLVSVLIFLFLLAACGGDDPTPPGPLPEPGKNQVRIGTLAQPEMTYSWSPADSLDNPLTAQPLASPKKTTTYTLTVTSKCGSATSKVIVHIFKPGPDGELVEQL